MNHGRRCPCAQCRAYYRVGPDAAVAALIAVLSAVMLFVML